MSDRHEMTTLTELLDRIEAGTEGRESISMGVLLETVGDRSFGPMLLLAGLVMVAPIVGDIPGVPSIMGVLVVLSAIQMLLRRNHLWLPQWLLRRSISQSKVRTGLKWLRPPARVLDRISQARITVLTRGLSLSVIAVACTMIALATPVMEVVPFSANLAGAALTAFGLSLIARDGLLAVVALVFTAGTFGFLLYGLL